MSTRIKYALTIFFVAVITIALIGVMTDSSYAGTVKLNKTKLSMHIGDAYKLKVKGTKSKVKWTSSNKKVAGISSKGKVYAKKIGSSTITAKVKSKRLKCRVRVKSALKAPSTISVLGSETKTIAVKYLGSKEPNWEYKIDREDLADVSMEENQNNAVFTVKSKDTGVTRLTVYSDADHKDKKTIKINTDTGSNAELSETSIQMFSGQQKFLLVNGTKMEAEWTNSDPSVVSIKNEKLANYIVITGKSPGTAKISAKVGDKTLTCDVTVKSTLEVSESNLTIEKSSSRTVTVTAYGGVRFSNENPSIVSCRWGSSNVDANHQAQLIITARSSGSADIVLTNSLDNSSLTIHVTVPSSYSLTLPSTPLSIVDASYGGLQRVQIYNVSYSVIEVGNEANITINLTGVKTDGDSPNIAKPAHIGYRLLLNGVVVKSGTIYTPNITQGESFSASESFFVSNPGNYTLELKNVI